MSNIRLKTEENKRDKDSFDDINKCKNNNKSFFNILKMREINEQNFLSIEGTSTGRNRYDDLKESKNNLDINTSVDINSIYEKEVNIRKIYNLSYHNSDLKCLNKNKTDINCYNEDIINKSNNKKNTIIGEFISKIENEKITDNDDCNNTIVNEESFDSNENNTNNNFNEIIERRITLFEKEYEELIKKNNIFHTKILFNKKDSLLLLKGDFLYILEIKPKLDKKQKETKNNENNPEQSLLYQLQKDEILSNINIDILKIDYDLSHPLLCINFNLLSCKVLLNKENNNKNNKNYEIQILILGCSKKFIFFIQNYEIYQKFIFLIHLKIINSDGYRMNKLGASLRRKKFYEDTYISLHYFDSIAKTGDLLLFQTKECISKCQRLYTRDQYDHIAIVIITNGIIEILESTSSENCNLLDWRRFKFNFYNVIFKKIVLRRLNIEEDDPNELINKQESIEDKSQQFIEKIKKKKYDISLFKILFGGKPNNYEVNGNWEKSKGFTCSALAAAFYIYNGIMKLEKSVHCARPGDFEQDKNRLIIQPGFSFGPEKILEFST